MNYTDILGLVSACLTTISFIPQAIKTIRYQNTDGISLLMYLLFVVGVMGWLIYGIAKQDVALIFANVLTLLFSSSILLIKIKNDFFTTAKNTSEP